MKYEQNAPTPSSRGRLLPGAGDAAPLQSLFCGFVDSCAGGVFVPVCTAAMMAGVHLGEREHGVTGTATEASSPFQGATHVWDNIVYYPPRGGRFVFVANHCLLLSSVFNQDKMFPVFVRILLMKEF